MKYSKTFDIAQGILEDREATYGSALPLHTNIATRWSLVLNKEVTAVQVARCLAEIKAARVDLGDSLGRDSAVDQINYLAIAVALEADDWPD